MTTTSPRKSWRHRTPRRPMAPQSSTASATGISTMASRRRPGRSGRKSSTRTIGRRLARSPRSRKSRGNSALTRPLREAADEGLHHRGGFLYFFLHHRILAGEAGGAVEPLRIVAVTHGVEHSLLGEISEGVGFDELADLVDRLRAGDQLTTLRCVDAVVARARRRRRGDTHVHFLGPELLQHADDLLR